MKKLLATICTSALGLTSAFAGSRSSANYSVPAESTDGSGARVQSANYTFNGSAIGETGAGAAAVVTSSNYASKPGYVGQLYEIVALSITAPPSTNLNESASRQLLAAPLADDNTTLAALDPATVSWSVQSGPIASISSGGLATAANVYQDTGATVGGMALSLGGQLNLTILNVGLDDYHEYAADMIDDAWQVQYFGQPPNPNAGPNADPDGDGQNNKFEFVAGVVPTDAASRFALRIQTVSGQAAQKQIIFSPRLNDRTYVPKFRLGLTTGSWDPLTGTTQSDNGVERTVTDPNGTGVRKFYAVEIAKP